MLQLKVFTVKEANHLIPELSDIILTLQQKHDHMAQKEVEIDALELVTDPDSKESFSHLNAEIEGLNRLISEFNQIVDKIHSHGCFLKDVDRGLVDFYAVLDGKVVYLCWKLGEEQIGYWHEVGKGYASRQPLSPEAGHEA